MAGVFDCKNAFTQPAKTNDTPTDRESNGCDSSAKDAFDAFLAPGVGWSSPGFDCEWTYSPFEFNTDHPPFLDGQRIEYSRNAALASDLYSLDHRLSPTPRTIGDVYDLLEDDFLFRVTARSGVQPPFSCVLQGLETNLAELQVAGDVLPPHSTLLEEGWSRLSTPALSVASDISEDVSLRTPSTPPIEHSVVPAAILVPGVLSSSPTAEIPAPQDLGSSEESLTLDSQDSTDERKLASSSKKRKRDAPEVSDTRESSPESPSQGDDEKWHKWFRIEGRSKSRRSSQSKVTVHTEYGESCCSRVGAAGYCQFEWRRNGRPKKCGVELIRDRDIVTSHFALHFEDMEYYSMAENDPEWKPHCPWCRAEPTTFDNLLRHINYSELELNLTRCGCGGSINRGNQGGFRARHEATKKHQEWLAQTSVAVVVGSEDKHGEQQPEFVEGSSRGTKRRRVNAKVVQAASDEEDEECDEFIEDSSSDATRRRSNARRARASVKEEPGEQEELSVEDTAAARKRRKAKRTKVTSKEDSDEEDEFVQGSSTGTKRRRLR